jgi:hypothetical protein
MNKLTPFIFLFFGIIIIPISFNIQNEIIKLLVLGLSIILLFFSIYLFAMLIKKGKRQKNNLKL